MTSSSSGPFRAVSWTESSSVLWFESRLEYSCVSLINWLCAVHLTSHVGNPTSLGGWPDRVCSCTHFPVTGDRFVSIRCQLGRVDSMKSVEVSLSIPPLGRNILPSESINPPLGRNIHPSEYIDPSFRKTLGCLSESVAC